MICKKLQRLPFQKETPRKTKLKALKPKELNMRTDEDEYSNMRRKAKTTSNTQFYRAGNRLVHPIGCKNIYQC